VDKKGGCGDLKARSTMVKSTTCRGSSELGPVSSREPMAHHRPISALIHFRLLIFGNFTLSVLCKFFKILVYLVIFTIYIVIKDTKIIIKY